MKIIGVTGPSGCGKGFLSAELAKLGYIHADADAIYHNLLQSSAPLREELVRAFGAEIERDGVIDRKIFGSKVFGVKNRRKLEKLNKITHKYVCREYVKLILKLKAEDAKGLIIDAPLLIEARLHKLCDINVLALCDFETRVSRIMARDNISREAALLRLRSQKPIEFYTNICDYIFINDHHAGAATDAAAHIEQLLWEENHH